MKRSRYVALIGMGTGAFILTACEDPNEMLAAESFENVAACVAAGHDEADCTSASETAVMSYEDVHPKYAKQADCEKNAGEGRCEPDYPNAREHSWRPSMLGFLIGTAIASRVEPQPVVANAASSSGRATVGGAPIVGNGQNVTVPARAAAPATVKQIASAHTAATTVARGGFGTTAARVSGSAGHTAGG